MDGEKTQRQSGWRSPSSQQRTTRPCFAGGVGPDDFRKKTLRWPSFRSPGNAIGPSGRTVSSASADEPTVPHCGDAAIPAEPCFDPPFVERLFLPRALADGP
jgi:hypothetical protein